MDLNISFSLFFTSILFTLISIHIFKFISRVDSLRHIYDEGDVLYILRSKFLLSSMYYAAHSVLTLFSALSFPRSLSLLSPCLFVCALMCVIFIYLFLLYTTASLHSRAFAKMSKVPAYLRYIFVALLSMQEDTNNKTAFLPLSFLFICTYCPVVPHRNYIIISESLLRYFKKTFSL